MEIWITAFNLENYEVSNFGRVRSKDKIVLTGSKKISTRVHKGKIIKPCDNGKGYKYFKLSDKGVKRNQYIHIIIALSFIPNPKNKNEVNHKNGIKSDNCISNLEWCTKKENMLHANKNGLFKNKRGYKAIPVFQIKDGLLIKWESARKASECLKIDQSSIHKCANGALRSAGGFTWIKGAL